MSASDHDHAREALFALRSRVDEHFTAAAARSPAQMQCGSGCDACCHTRISVFAIEADRVALALAELQRRSPQLRARVRRAADDPEHAERCPLLIDARCSIYAERPLICRSHGLPIAVTDRKGKTSVANCSLNFRLHPPPPTSVLRLQAVNEPLAVMAQLWRSDPPRSGPARIELATLARADESADPARHD